MKRKDTGSRYVNVVDEDIKWMLAVRDGDENGFEKLLNKYKKPLINFIFRFTGDRWESEDLAQEVFLRIYRAKDRYKPKAKFSTYLYKIATNVCIDYRKKKKLKIVSLDSPAYTDDGERTREISDMSVESQDLSLEDTKIIRDAFLSLPRKQSIALNLRIYEGKTYREIAVILGCSVKAVETLLFRSRRNLRKYLIHKGFVFPSIT